MATSLKHSTVVVVPDDGVSPVGTNEWNAEHVFTMDSGNVLGRASAGNGPVEQITNNFVTEAPNDGFAYLRSSLGWSSGGIIKGALILQYAQPQIVLNGSNAQPLNQIVAERSGNFRWAMKFGANTETGTGNAGSDFSMERYTDAGVFIDTPFSIDRTSGAAHFKDWVNIEPASGNPTFNLVKPAAGTANAMNGYGVGALLRWSIQPGDSAAESTGNVGSNFSILRCNDAGAVIDTPFSISRVDGAVRLSSASGNPTLSMLKPASGNANTIIGYTAGVPRWVVSPGDNTAESTGNLGSNFSIIRYSDAGSLIDAPFTINRASGSCILKGTNTNDNAAAGQVGEYVSTFVGPPGSGAMASGTVYPLMSLALGAGDWDVTGFARFYTTVASAGQWQMAAELSTTSSTIAGDALSYSVSTGWGFTGYYGLPLMQKRFSLSAAGTVYLNVQQQNGGAGGVVCSGYLRARRVR